MRNTFFTACAATALAFACPAMAQVQYTATFDSPPYTLDATIINQQAWVAGNAGSTATPAALQVVGTAPFAGNGCYQLNTWNGTGTASSYSVDQIAAVGSAYSTAIAGGATSVDASVQFMLPATSTGPSTHFVGVFALPAAGSTTLRYLGGLQTYAGPYTSGSFSVVAGEVVMLQWLEPPTVAAAGNYQIKFATPLVLTPGQWTEMVVRWDPVAQTPSFKVGTSEFVPGYATGALTCDRIRVGGSPTLGTNTISSTGKWDSLAVVGNAPAYPQCTPSAGDCDAAHPTGGCNIVSCCETICGILPSCCDTGWDQGCVDVAIPECGLFVYNCTSPNSPANNCAISPQVVTVTGTPTGFAFDTTAATTDGPPEPDCNSSDNDTPIHKDVWYRFIAPTDGVLTATNCFAGDFDSKIAAYDIGTNLAAFDPQQLPDYFIGCNEDCDDPAFTSTLSVSGIVGGHYYLVRLGGFEGASGTGTLTLSVAPPPNPCDPANLIQGVAGSQIVTLDTAYDNFTPGALCSVFTGDVWNAKMIKFTSPGTGSMTVQNCADTTGNVDARIVAMTTCGVANSVVACDDDGCTGEAPYASKLVFNAVAGQTYYFAVGGYDNTEVGPFNIEIIAPAAPSCPADLNQDGVVNGADLGLMLGSWGPCPGCAADLNADGIVNGADLGLLLGSWGACA
jgi:hypothetical protein